MSRAAVDKQPPSDLKAEIGVLGSILLNVATLPPITQIIQSPEYFYSKKHKNIWNACLALYKEGIPFDPITLADQLKSSHELAETESISYLSKITDETPTSAHADHYARIVAQKWQARQQIRVLESALGQVNTGQVPISLNKLRGEVFKPLESAASDLSNCPTPMGGQPDIPLDPMSFLRKGAELQQMDCKIEWAIDSLLPKQSITLLHGRGGIGKTWLCLILADAISKGISFMGLNTQRIPVVYVDFENSLPVLVERVRKIQIEDVLFWHTTNEVLTPPKLDCLKWESYKILPKDALVVFDTLRASQSQDENDSKQMAFVMARLKELRDAGFTILLLHHTPKSNDRTYKGSTVILDLADHVLSLHKVRKNNLEETADDEESEDVLYRLGTKDKTRYEPYHLFMAFDPEKGFVKAADPVEDDLQAIQEILASKGVMNQGQLFEAAKANLAMNSKGKVVNLFKKGEGKFWVSHKERGATIYEALPAVQLSGSIGADNRTVQETVSEVERPVTPSMTEKIITNKALSGCPGEFQTVWTNAQGGK
jgi:archaellum biogenesis ATPase FlaH